MEFAVLPTGIGGRGQLAQQLVVEGPPGEGRIELRGVDATDHRGYPGAQHVAGQCGGVAAPQQEHRLEAGSLEFLLPVGPDVGQEQIAERHPGDTLFVGGGDDRGHRRLVLLVAARPRNVGLVQRQVNGLRLSQQQFPAHPMHCDPVRTGVDGADQPDDIDLGLFPQHRQGESAVLAGAPGEQRLRPDHATLPWIAIDSGQMSSVTSHRERTFITKSHQATKSPAQILGRPCE